MGQLTGEQRRSGNFLKTAAELRRGCGFQITNQVVIIGCCLSGGSCRSWAHSSPSRLHHWLQPPGFGAEHECRVC
jgi:hypothetical protein